MRDPAPTLSRGAQTALDAIDRALDAHDATRRRDYHGLVRTLNGDYVPADAYGHLRELETAGLIRTWGGGYVWYLDRVLEPRR